MKTLEERDASVIWHPYSQHGLKYPILPVVSAQGAYLYLEDGRKILDGISSWWVNLHGHAHPRIARAIAAQCEKMEHVIFAGFTHEPAVKLAETIMGGTHFARAFYSDNGSTAVEVALKIAYQYHLNRGDTKRQKFLALRHSYHGDTLGAMAVGEPDGYHAHFRSLLPRVDFVEPCDLGALKDLGSYAAFIFEPMVQGAGGMRMYPASYLREAIGMCRSHGVLTIGDEVFTGFFRTGTCFAYEYLGIAPDLLCLSKGITGGFLPLAMTLATESIFEVFCSQDMRQAFLHGHSYTANPVACAAALESWSILHSEECQARLTVIQAITRERIKRFKKARCIGTIGAVEMQGEHRSYLNAPPALLARQALARGVLLRPLGDVIYTVPPYCVTDQELHLIYDVIEEMLYSIGVGG